MKIIYHLSFFTENELDRFDANYATKELALNAYRERRNLARLRDSENINGKITPLIVNYS